MTAAELKTALTRLGYTQAGFAHLLGVHRVTVQHWARGTYPVPRYVEVIVELSENEQKLAEAAEQTLERISQLLNKRAEHE